MSGISHEKALIIDAAQFVADAVLSDRTLLQVGREALGPR
jgi:hypothetical protein